MLSIAKLSPRRIFSALAWRFRHLIGDERIDRVIVHAARIWRPALRRPQFIGIAGSAGKTTTKELLQRMLSLRLHGISNPFSLNALPEVAKVVLRLRPSHDFCITELSEDRPGIMDQPLSLLRPDIGIVTVVGRDHWSAFNSKETIAREIGKLVSALPAHGTAVLNADDEMVSAMAEACPAKVITYGISSNATLRADSVSSVWPDRLKMKLTWGLESAALQTQLCGTHFLPAVLGAIGGGLAAGLTLRDCVEGIGKGSPFEGRMQPVRTPEGVTFIRDDFKAPLWTVDTCFEFMRQARAQRKIIVIGELSDVGSAKEDKYRRVARRAQDIADITVFVGLWGSSALATQQSGKEDAVRFFIHVRDAADYLKRINRPGDLVLLKGTNKHDHLLRIILTRTDEVACWRNDCKRHDFCDQCDHRMTPSGAAPSWLELDDQKAKLAVSIRTAELNAEPGGLVIVGMGNPESRYRGTPHNVGYEVVEQLAELWKLEWSETPEAWVARGFVGAQAVYLVKARAAMNLTGQALKRLSQHSGFTPAKCILVFDDLSLPIGSIRYREAGGAGGHRGVASVLEAFQSSAFQRLKLGVGQAHARHNQLNYVISPWDTLSRPQIDLGIRAASNHISAMLQKQDCIFS